MRIFFLLVLLSFAGSYLFYNVWKKSALEGGDNWGYYSYLPATFIYKDLKTLDVTYEARNRIHGTTAAPRGIEKRITEASDAPNGNRVIKYTMGIAVMQSPFFFIAHTYQKLTGGSAGGFEFPYVLAVFFSVLFYVFLGLYFISKALAKWYSTVVVFLTLLAVYFATNLYYFTSLNIGMSHAYLFFWYSLLVYSTILFFEKPGWTNAVSLGLSFGMITLIRPSEIISLLIPLLYGLHQLKNAESIRLFFIQKWKYLFAAAITIILVPLPQFIYWKAMSGHWLYDSYPGEHFDFLKPRIIDGMFGYKNGWLSYTTVMWLVFPGIYFLWKHKHPFRLIISVILPLHIYIIYSWWCWQYTNGYGSRPMVETYGYLAVPLAAVIHEIVKRSWTTVLLFVFYAFCITHNVFQTWQIENGKYYSDDATRTFYLRRMYKWDFDYNDLVAFDNDEVQPKRKNLIFIKQLAIDNFEQPSEFVRDSVLKFEGNYSSAMVPGKDYNGGIEIGLGGIEVFKGDYLKISAQCYSLFNPNIYNMGRIVAELRRGDELLKWLTIRIQNKIKPAEGYQLWYGEQLKWQEVSFFVKLPDDFKGTERIRAYPWNPAGADFRVDQLKIELWRTAR